MPLFGAHISTAGGLHTAFGRAESIGCDALQIFTKSNRQWRAPVLKEEDIAAFQRCAAETRLPVTAHASYLINLASPQAAIWEKSVAALIEELDRCRRLGIDGLVLHPGAHTGSGYEAGIAQVAAALDRVHEAGDSTSRVLLEVTAGAGTTLGFESWHFEAILARLREPERVALCFDTCHALGAGWDIVSREGYERTMDDLAARVGLERLACFHLNDSRHPLGSRRDRHEHIGYGLCTLEAFRHLVNDPRFADRPMLLETPKGEDMAEDVVNLRVLRALVEGSEEQVDVETLDDFWEGVSRTEGKDE